MGTAIPRSAFSKNLKEANQKISNGEHASALVTLNKLAKGESIPKRLGKILLLTALSEANLGRYPESAKIFAQALNQFRADSDPAWFSAALGQVCPLL